MAALDLHVDSLMNHRQGHRLLIHSLREAYPDEKVFT